MPPSSSKKKKTKKKTKSPFKPPSIADASSRQSSSLPGSPVRSSQPRLCFDKDISSALPSGTIAINTSFQDKLLLALYDYILLAPKSFISPSVHNVVIGRVVPHTSATYKITVAPDIFCGLNSKADIPLNIFKLSGSFAAQKEKVIVYIQDEISWEDVVSENQDSLEKVFKSKFAHAVFSNGQQLCFTFHGETVKGRIVQGDSDSACLHALELRLKQEEDLQDSIESSPIPSSPPPKSSISPSSPSISSPVLTNQSAFPPRRSPFPSSPSPSSSQNTSLDQKPSPLSTPSTNRSAFPPRRSPFPPRSSPAINSSSPQNTSLDQKPSPLSTPSTNRSAFPPRRSPFPPRSSSNTTIAPSSPALSSAEDRLAEQLESLSISRNDTASIQEDNDPIAMQQKELLKSWQSQFFPIDMSSRIQFAFLSEASLKSNDEGVKKEDGSTSQELDSPKIPSFGDIGGLEKQVGDIRETIELALHRPELFTQYGLACPRGILLVGPPGTGKTLIARVVAHQCGAAFSLINGPEMLSRTYGETENKLKSLFESAAVSGKHVIFIDEIDAMCPSRDGAASDMEKRIVTIMLTLMDGIGTKFSNARVVVLAATNKPDVLDSALRRPGRFDREIEIGVPSAKQRESILTVLLAKYKHCLQENEIKSVAARAHGYVGADLAAVCREAGLRVIKRNASKSNLPEDLQVTLEDLQYGLSHTRPSALREVAVEVPTVRWKDIGGQEEVKQCLREAVEWPLKFASAFEQLGIRAPKGILMYGPPGCSKTLTAKALANESQLNFIAVKGPELFSKWVGESERSVREIFRKARVASPSIIFFDEIDALGAKRGGGEEGTSVADRVLTQLLVEMDGVSSLQNVTVIAATNRPDLVDDALLRPGRFDRKVYVGPPDLQTRMEILKLNIKKMPHEDDLEAKLEELAKACSGFSGAEVVSVCREAAMMHLEESEGNPTVVPSHCFFAAANNITPNITKEMLDFYHTYNSN